MSGLENIPHCPCMAMRLIELSHDPLSSGYAYDSVPLGQAMMERDTHVFSKHGTPSHVTSDQGSEFVSHFFQSLGKLLWMELHFTSGYHPEGDGQMEHLNQVLEQYLRAYTNYQQDDWSSLLPSQNSPTTMPRMK